MTLVEHAQRELELARVEEDVRPSLIQAIEAFSSYGHSGGSYSICAPMLYDLLNYRPLTPLTDDPSEWVDVAKQSGYTLWQNARDSEAFSIDGGKHYYLLREERRWVRRLLSFLPWKIRRNVPRAVLFPIRTAVSR